MQIIGWLCFRIHWNNPAVESHWRWTMWEDWCHSRKRTDRKWPSIDYVSLRWVWKGRIAHKWRYSLRLDSRSAYKWMNNSCLGQPTFRSSWESRRSYSQLDHRRIVYFYYRLYIGYSFDCPSRSTYRIRRMWLHDGNQVKF